MKVLVVDDSIVFRSQISACLNDQAEINVVGSASNGKIAIQKLQQHEIDLITLDMEMPEMNGIETIKEIKRLGIKVKIIVFSSQTVQGAHKALEALKLGADDVVAKPSGDIASFDQAFDMIKSALIPRIRQFLIRSDKIKLDRDNSVIKQVVKSEKKFISINTFSPEAIVIASSTGGPNALEVIFSKLKVQQAKPIFIVQHMPPVFTQILAKRLSEVSGLNVIEAKHNTLVEKNMVYVAPGGYHMRLLQDGLKTFITLDQEALCNSVRPAADHLFKSAADIWSDKLLGFVLTGMGEDGAQGASYIKEKSGAIIIQDQKSCVVFGMPGAVFANKDYDAIMELEKISDYLKTVMI